MPSVTVGAGSGQDLTLQFDSSANAALAARLAAAITAGVNAGSIIPEFNSTPPLPPGKTGLFIETQDHVTFLPPGYADVVELGKSDTIFGSGDKNEAILSGESNLTFIATGGSGTVVAGAGQQTGRGDIFGNFGRDIFGNFGRDDAGRFRGDDDAVRGGNMIVVPLGDNGNWLIETGGGNDTISALGGGNNTIGAGAGHNLIRLGSGQDSVESSGNDTVYGGTGSETIDATSAQRDVIHGGASQLLYFAGSGPTTIFGGTGSVTTTGGTGREEIHGGLAGNNSIVAGSGPATLFGGGNGDQLIGGSGKDEFVAGVGNSTLTAGSGQDDFEFRRSMVGGNVLIQDFKQGIDHIDLDGYGDRANQNAVATQMHPTPTSTMVTLSDGTKITFADVTSLKVTDFR
jgi:Ca2+-binding RTX toxin-like protein